MKLQIYFLFFFFLGIQSAEAQHTRLSFQLARLGMNKARSAEQVYVLIKGDPAQIHAALDACGGSYLYNIGTITSAGIKAGMLNKLASAKGVDRIEAGSIRLHPLNDTMVYLTRVNLVHQGFAPLPHGYDGKGIVCGFIDTGIDYTHGDFKDSLGHSRIKYIWDQTMPSASNTPQPFNYGQEWNNLQIDSGKCTHTDTLQWGHGTRVAGTAAGNGMAVNRYGGVAPRADIIVVAVDFNRNGPTIADGATYIFSKAQAMGKPCVINCSLGSELGSHDGMDLETQVIDSLLNQQAGRVFVAATGNSGNVSYHLTNTLTNDSSFTWMRFNANDTANGSTQFDMQIFGDSASIKGLQFTLAADRVSPSYAACGRTLPYSIPSNLGIMVNDTIKNGGNRIAVLQSYEQHLKGVYSIEFVITPDSTTYNYRIAVSGTGKFDAWSWNMLSAPIPTAAAFPPISKYKLPDTDESIETGFQCSPHVISVANYVNKNCFTDVVDSVVCDTTFQFRPRRLDPQSGHGPTRLGLQKPDIAAPGDYIMSCLVLSMKHYFWNSQLAKGGQHIAGGGTSQASPVITGLAALLLQQNPTWTHLQVKNAITCSAMSDVYTGTSLPNYEWGYGKVDAFQAMNGCSPLFVTNPPVEQTGFQVWPNPFEASATVSFGDFSGNG
ncbi:MAG TPA: S8 family serine peptidase, partial [Bacteroidia bacterium]|nr:S8 family serine peptidase [Bacteroidia bacterium]